MSFVSDYELQAVLLKMTNSLYKFRHIQRPVTDGKAKEGFMFL